MKPQNETGRIVLEDYKEVEIAASAIVVYHQHVLKDDLTRIGIAQPNSEFPLPPLSYARTEELRQGLELVAEQDIATRFGKLTPTIAKGWLLLMEKQYDQAEATVHEFPTERAEPTRRVGGRSGPIDKSAA